MSKTKAWLKQYLADWKYAFYVMLHPFKGFWELKHDKKASRAVSWTLYILFVLVGLIFQQFGAYTFNAMAVSPENINLLSDTVVFALVLILWIYSNWGITTLFNGEGSTKDIFHYTAYSLLPYILFTVALTILSQFLCSDELMIFNFLQFLGIFWTGILVYCGTMTTHQYGAVATFLGILVIAFGMALLAFVGMLFFFLLQQIIGVVYTVYRELTMRY